MRYSMNESDIKIKKVFIAPLNWGLGHATRLLPLIRMFLERDYTVYIGAVGRSKELLLKEVPDCIFIDFPEYPIKYSKSRFFVTRFMLITFPQMLLTMVKEKRVLKKLQAQYQFSIIISDNRFGMALKNEACFLISHQLRYKLPWPIGRMEWLPEYFNYVIFKNYHRILVPDRQGAGSLSGELSHNLRYIPKKKLNYTGIITDLSLQKKGPSKPLDYFVIISGPEPQRTIFEQIIFEQIANLEGRIIGALGTPEKDYKIRIGGAIFYSYLSREEIVACMSASKFIIARPGYTTMMEMVELGKKGLFVPTPGQIEQEYLARYFMDNGWCYSARQIGISLSDAVAQAKTYDGFPNDFSPTRKNINNLFRYLESEQESIATKQ